LTLTEQDIASVVTRLVRRANTHLPVDVEKALHDAGRRERSSPGRMCLDVLAENARLARRTGLPICQDTGIDVVFVEMGQELHFKGELQRAVDTGIARGTAEGHLRCSVCDPLTRINTGDNTPAVLHVTPIPGKNLTVSVLPKGCGSENMSALAMLPPSAGIEGVIRTVVEQVRRAGPNPCPPGIVGVGLGGTMETAALIAKRSLLRPVGARHPRPDVAALEERILREIDASGVGPLGLGGLVTALGVAVEVSPCHIASLPVAVNIQCHAARHCTARLLDGRWEESSFAGFEESPCDPAAPTFSDPPRMRRIGLPLTREAAASLRAGDWVALHGPLYTGRDQTHRRLVRLLEAGRPLPVDLRDEFLYYTGPSPAWSGRPVGSAGPTTSYRMDSYTPQLLALGLLATMGKGRRSPAVRDALRTHGALYLATIGGAGAYLGSRVRSCTTTAFPELGPEALYRMEVYDFPAVVVNDVTGADLYEQVEGAERPEEE